MSVTGEKEGGGTFGHRVIGFSELTEGSERTEMPPGSTGIPLQVRILSLSLTTARGREALSVRGVAGRQASEGNNALRYFTVSGTLATLFRLKVQTTRLKGNLIAYR